MLLVELVEVCGGLVQGRVWPGLDINLPCWSRVSKLQRKTVRGKNNVCMLHGMFFFGCGYVLDTPFSPILPCFPMSPHLFKVEDLCPCAYINSLDFGSTIWANAPEPSKYAKTPDHSAHFYAMFI